MKTTVTTENCVLHVVSAGSGADLLVLIPGGFGVGNAFYATMPGLSSSSTSTSNTKSKSYTVATFDRRGHGASNLRPSGARVDDDFNPAQSARDVLAIIKHLGFERASVFGTSGGGIIALQFAVMFPQHVDKLIPHETPTMALLLPPAESVAMLDFCFAVYRTYKTDGPTKALRQFLGLAKGWKATGSQGDSASSGSEPTSKPETEKERAVVEEEIDPQDLKEHIYWFDHEYVTMTTFTPNLFGLKSLLEKYSTTMSCACTAGEASADAPYARTTYAQRNILGCQHHVWPGGHLVYKTDPPAFVRALLETLTKLDDGRN